MLRKIAALAALCLPTFAHSEVIELFCRYSDRPELAPFRLLIDTSRARVQYGFWDWSASSKWTEELILWTAFGGFSDNPSENDPTIASFIFKRVTGELSIRVFSEFTFYGPPGGVEIYSVQNCVRPI